MNAIVVYESHWGNTAAIASAIAEGIGPDAKAMSTAEAICSRIARTGRCFTSRMRGGPSC